MSIAADLITYLKTISAVTTLVGSGTAARIYEDTALQGAALPYILFEVFDGASAEYLGGISGMGENRVELTCYASDSAGATTLGESVRLPPLKTYRGLMHTNYVRVTPDGGDTTGHDPLIQGANQRRYWHRRDYLIFKDEAVTA